MKEQEGTITDVLMESQMIPQQKLIHSMKSDAYMWWHIAFGFTGENEDDLDRMAEEEMKELKETEGEDDAQKDDEVKEEEEGEGQDKEDEDKPGEEMHKWRL